MAENKLLRTVKCLTENGLERLLSKTTRPQRKNSFDLRKDRAAQGGWHGEGPHRETTLRQ